MANRSYLLLLLGMPKSHLVLILCILGYTLSFGQNPNAHILESISVPSSNLNDSLEILLDRDLNKTINSILNDQQNRFGHPELDNEYQNIAVWSRIRVLNTDLVTRHEFLTFCRSADSISIYKVQNDHVIEEFLSGMDVLPWQKKIFSSYNFVPISIQPDEEVIYYFRTKFQNKITKRHLSELMISPQRDFMNQHTSTFTKQAFYSGFMILFCGVCFLMYQVFKERIFLYFGFLLIAFVFYFLSVNGILQTLVSYYWNGANDYALNFSISLIVLSLYLFVSKYLKLKERFPRLNMATIIVTAITALLVPVAMIFGPVSRSILNVLNGSLIVWIFVIMAPIIYLSRKDKSVRILLYSIGIIFICALLYLLQILNVFPQTWLTKNGFQIGTIFFSGIIFKSLFDRINMIRSEKDRMEQLGQIKSRFFANISHEFRTPLTLVMGPIQNQIDKAKDPKDKKELTTALKSSQRLLQLINQLLDLSKLESGKMELNKKSINFPSLLKGIVMSFESMAQRKNMKLHFVSQKEEIAMHVDQDKIEQIFYNLLSNAFKFTNENDEISVMIADHANEIEIIVRDNGIGISDAQLEHIFERFYQADSTETREQQGTGIGLALVNELVRLHEGNIQVSSQEGQGSTFTIQLPKEKSESTVSEMAPKTSAPLQSIPVLFEQEAKGKIINPVVLSSDKPSVLIIEDNRDVRQYVRQHLDPMYEILEAQNGQEGIDLALKFLPDLIISDVMMPQKNGYEVCEKLKTDQHTSHIPIILLTAKATQDEKLLGLNTGADDYLIKPFNSKELSVRVKNLIASRLELRKHYAQSSLVEIEKASNNPIDQQFLSDVLSTIEDNLGDNQLNVDFLAEKVGMSRGHLNRKIKALTDLSVNKFIQSFKLNKANELLKANAGNVSEIAFKTGFSSTAYFVKCFREKFDVTPGSILNS